jgi:hypothetical protein
MNSREPRGEERRRDETRGEGKGGIHMDGTETKSEDPPRAYTLCLPIYICNHICVYIYIQSKISSVAEVPIFNLFYLIFFLFDGWS